MNGLGKVRTGIVVFIVATLGIFILVAIGIFRGWGTHPTHSEESFFLAGTVNPDSLSVAIVSKQPSHPSELWLVGTSGNTEKVVGQVFKRLGTPDWSPDGTRLVVEAESHEKGDSVWIIDIRSGEMITLVGPSPTTFYFRPLWNPQGDKIAYASIAFEPEKRNSIWVADVASGRNPVCVAKGATTDIDLLALAWSANSQQIYYYSHYRKAIMSIDICTGVTRAIPIPENLGSQPRIYPSPDGRLLLVCSEIPEEGTENVWILRPNNGSAKPIPLVCGGTAAWSSDSTRFVLELDPSAGGGLYVFDMTSDTGMRLTAEGMSDVVLRGRAWTSDDRIFYMKSRRQLMCIKEDGSGDIVLFP